MPSSPKLSALVVAHNEETQLGACLERLEFADEIVVVLDRCTDGSAAIARRFAEYVVEGDWPIEGDRRNLGLDTCTGDWILEVDADERVNQVTPSLFARYPTPAALAEASPSTLEPQIQSTGFFRVKSRSLVGMARALVEHHDGDVPANLDALVRLPGVGRKTANVVLGHALGVPGLPVDRHVLRVANRLGIARSSDPAVVERQMGTVLPKARWTLASDILILHGRRICKPRPLCDRCRARQQCLFDLESGRSSQVRDTA